VPIINLAWIRAVWARELTLARDLAVDQKPDAGDLVDRPTDLGLNHSKARNRNVDELTNGERLAPFNAATLVGEIGDLDRHGAAVGAMDDGVDYHRQSVLASNPAVHALHHSPHEGKVFNSRRLIRL
jgi:hypothetical protein